MAELTSVEDRLRHQLGLLYSDVAVELRRRERSARRTVNRVRVPAPRIELPGVGALEALRERLPAIALEALGDFALAVRALTGRDVVDLATMAAILAWIKRQSELGNRGLEWEVDEFGFDREWTESLLPIFRWIYDSYWRVETTGAENVPDTGGALLVSNHAGVLPWDGAMIKTALFAERPGNERHARALIAQVFFQWPWLSWFLRRTGNTLGHPDDTLRLLRNGELVLVFPEGVKGTGKLWNERYRLRRFGRGGFVQVAIEARVPIIPVSVVGSEEIYPMLGNLEGVARLFGLPYFPVTPFWPWLGVLGMVPLPTKWRIHFHPPVRTDELPIDAADDANQVLTVTDQVRETIQDGLYENLRLRRGIFT